MTTVHKTYAPLQPDLMERINHLEELLIQEATLNHIFCQVNACWTEEDILKVTVRELLKHLKLQGCAANQYYSARQGTTSQIQYSEVLSNSTLEQAIYSDRIPAVYRSFLQKLSLQFCPILPPGFWLNRSCHYSILVCPLVVDQQILGDIWLYKSEDESFSRQEVEMVERIVEQVAIALQRIQHSQEAERRIQNLQDLHQAKDDFLQIVAHEVRAPMANMLIAIQLLQQSLMKARSHCEPIFNLDHVLPLAQELPCNQSLIYLEVLKSECDREINLINELLDLQQLDATSHSLQFTEVYFQDWLPQLTEPFISRAEKRQQSLSIKIPDNLPPLMTNLDGLTRILRELLNNACKYTPSGEEIIVTAQMVELKNPQTDGTGRSGPLSSLELIVTNTGIQIPPESLPLIFEKFYRVPGGDPARQGGTGLGLALARKLVVRLGGALKVKSDPAQTSFVVEFPL